jgi:hypothetical protein
MALKLGLDLSHDGCLLGLRKQILSLLSSTLGPRSLVAVANITTFIQLIISIHVNFKNILNP